VFGVSLTEFLLIVVVALVVLGPQRLPSMLRTVGHWIYKIRTMTTEVRAQTGIDDLLRKEGFHGGLSEVRALLRGDPRPLIGPISNTMAVPLDDPYVSMPGVDEERERPVEGPDAYGAIPEDLLDEPVPAARREIAAALGAGGSIDGSEAGVSLAARSETATGVSLAARSETATGETATGVSLAARSETATGETATGVSLAARSETATGETATSCGESAATNTRSVVSGNDDPHE
jgi:sec-independent protein translocase protein TatB